MSGFFLPFLVLFVVFAIFFQESNLTLLVYLLAGIYIFGLLWSNRSLRSLKVTRKFERHAFIGETVSVSLQVKNDGWLPAGWVRLHESLPVELNLPQFFQRVFSLRGQEEWRGSYQLAPKKRGFYRVGPVQVETGDLFGLATPHSEWKQTDYLTVFPNIVPMPRFSLTSASPMGSMKSSHLVYEDPSRVRGKREYHAGDSLRRIDWKASAAAGHLQVKLFEPSQSLESLILLSMHPEEYDPKDREDAMELAVVAAASVANWVIQKRQTTGLATNGKDPLHPELTAHRIPPHKGRGHLMRMLDLLARVQSGSGVPLPDLLREESARLGWGATVVLIVGGMNDVIFHALMELRQHGHRPVLILTAPRQKYHEYKRRAERFGILTHEIRYEAELMSLRG